MQSSFNAHTFLLRYALLNLWRNPRRTLLTLLTVGFATGVSIVAQRYSSAIMRLWSDGAADTGTAHAQAFAPGYRMKEEGLVQDLTLVDGNAFERLVHADGKVEATVKRLVVEGMLSTGDESLYFIGKGVEAEKERAVSPQLFTAHDWGQWVDDAHLEGVVVGKGLADTLRLNLGSEVTLITQTVQGSVNGIDAKVVGIVDAAIPSFSQRVVYAPIELLRRLIRLPGRYTELAIKLKRDERVESWVQKMKGAVIGVDLLGWWELEPVINNVGKIWDSVVALISTLLFLSTALSVMNIIFMTVNERVVEIGTLMAIGAKPREVRRLFGLEASFIGLAGGFLGLTVGNAVVQMMAYFGVPFESPFGGGVVVVYPEASLVTSLWVFAAAVFVCWVSGLLPARRAAKAEPVRAFRGQLS